MRVAPLSQYERPSETHNYGSEEGMYEQSPLVNSYFQQSHNHSSEVGMCKQSPLVNICVQQTLTTTALDMGSVNSLP